MAYHHMGLYWYHKQAHLGLLHLVPLQAYLLQYLQEEPLGLCLRGGTQFHLQPREECMMIGLPYFLATRVRYQALTVEHILVGVKFHFSFGLVLLSNHL